MIPFKKFMKEKVVGTQHEYESHFENILFLCDKYLKDIKPTRILDLGFGNGTRTVKMAEYFDVPLSETYGLDYTDENFAACRKTFQITKADLEKENIPYISESFDLII